MARKLQFVECIKRLGFYVYLVSVSLVVGSMRMILLGHDYFLFDVNNQDKRTLSNQLRIKEVSVDTE